MLVLYKKVAVHIIKDMMNTKATSLSFLDLHENKRLMTDRYEKYSSSPWYVFVIIGLNMELDLQNLFGLYMHSCTHTLRPRNHPPPPPLRIWAHIRGRYWSTNVDISL